MFFQYSNNTLEIFVIEIHLIHYLKKQYLSFKSYNAIFGKLVIITAHEISWNENQTSLFNHVFLPCYECFSEGLSNYLKNSQWCIYRIYTCKRIRKRIFFFVSFQEPCKGSRKFHKYCKEDWKNNELVLFIFFFFCY